MVSNSRHHCYDLKMRNLTKRNHYNPCLWTALWNPEYYKTFQINAFPKLDPRKQLISALSVKSGHIFNQTTENVHFDKGLALAKLSKEDAAEISKKYGLNEGKLNTVFSKSDGPLYIDFEPLFSLLESLPPYATLFKVAQSGEISSEQDKAWLASFIVIQNIRSHAVMNSMIELQEQIAQHKIEHFIFLKLLLADKSFLWRTIYPLMKYNWIIYSADDDTFPLCDSPILVQPQSILAPLSPRLLLEIQQTVIPRKNRLFAQYKIKEKKLKEYRRRTIGNTFREIIGPKNVLLEWQNAPEFKERVSLLKRESNYNKLVEKRGNAELWMIGALNNKS